MQFQNPYFNQNYYRDFQQFNPRGQMQEKFEVVPVSSVDEAKNAIINPLNTYLFVDSSTGNIYYKRLGNNGLSEFLVYSLTEQKKDNPLAEINDRLTNIEKVLGGLKNDKSVSNVTEPTQSTVTNENGTNENEQSFALQKSRTNDKWKK